MIADNRHYEKVGSEIKDITDDLPFEIPDSWVWTRLEKAVIINPRNNLSDDIEVSFVEMKAILDGYTNQFIATNRLWKEVKRGFTHFQESDVGFAKITPCFQNRKSVVFTNLRNGYGAGTTELHVLRPIQRTIVPNYLLYFVKSSYFIEHGKQRFSGTAGQQRFGTDEVKKTLFPLPPLAEQARIVAEIEKFEPLIAEYDKLEQQATKLDDEIYDKLKKSILQYAIQGKLVPQDPNDEPASVLLERIRAEKKAKLGKKYVDSCIYKGDDNCYYEHIAGRTQDEPVEVPFDIPENWAFTRLDTIIGLSSGTNLTSATMAKSEQIYPVFGGNGITGYYDKYNIGVDHIIIGRVGFYCGSIHVTNKKSWITDNALIVSFDNSSISTSFFALLLESLELGKKSSATAQPLVTGKIIKPIIVALPPLAEQNRIVVKINEIFAML